MILKTCSANFRRLARGILGDNFFIEITTRGKPSDINESLPFLRYAARVRLSNSFKTRNTPGGWFPILILIVFIFLLSVSRGRRAVRAESPSTAPPPLKTMGWPAAKSPPSLMRRFYFLSSGPLLMGGKICGAILRRRV